MGSIFAQHLSAFAPWQIVFACAVVAFATIVQFRLGVGFGLTAAPLLALAAPSLVPVPVILLTLVTACTAMIATRGGIDWREVSFSLTGRFIGALGGAWILLTLTDKNEFMLVFGLMIAAAVVLSVAGLRFRFSRWLVFVMGTISGLMATVTSVGGPPMAIAYQDQPPERARPNLSAYFGIGCIIILVVLAWNGLVRMADIVHTAMLLPALLAGMIAAPYMKGLIDGNFRKLLLAVSGFAAVLLIVRGLL